MKNKIERKISKFDCERVKLAATTIKDQLSTKYVVKYPVPTRQITVPNWGSPINRGNLSLPNLIEWCEKQTDTRHQAITAWLVAAKDCMDVLTMGALKQSQIDSRKKER